ncbi:MAG: stage 0 sporulation protein [Elusimicrobiota bacterium]|jgi:cell fate regulator YaaT (PSP1 superfamily)|nr:stage 0 sporulation protein [Elusimicrobiota bacterium]
MTYDNTKQIDIDIIKVIVHKTKSCVFAEMPRQQTINIKKGDKVLLQIENILEVGVIEDFLKMEHIKLDKDEKIFKFIRKCSENDLSILKENDYRTLELIKRCQRIIYKHKLEMKLTTIEQTIRRDKLYIYYTAENRVDFRELLKDLSQVFKAKIQMVQIGVRDEIKVKGNLGQCGRVVCCKKFLKDFKPVFIDMAKEQGLSLNPTKISGACGRLICCLGFESEFYKNLLHKMPYLGDEVATNNGVGKVKSRNVLKEEVEVLFEDGTIGFYKIDNLTIKTKNEEKSTYKMDKDEELNNKNCSCPNSSCNGCNDIKKYYNLDE